MRDMLRKVLLCLMICLFLTACEKENECTVEALTNVTYTSLEEYIELSDYIFVVWIQSQTNQEIYDIYHDMGVDVPLTTYSVEILHSFKQELSDITSMRAINGEFNGCNYAKLYGENITANATEEQMMQVGNVYVVIGMDVTEYFRIDYFEILEGYNLELAYIDQKENFTTVVDIFENP